MLLCNIGTPKSPRSYDVYHYLKEFLNDSRVIDIPQPWRYILVNGIIVPFRFRQSAKTYQKIWQEEGSPLLINTKNLSAALQEALGVEYIVDYAMRYQQPSIERKLLEFQKKKLKKIIIFPLFPQYASATTGSTIEEVMRICSKWQTIPEISFINQFYDHPNFLEAVALQGEKYDHRHYDHILFSFHGLPERHLKKADLHGKCKKNECCHTVDAENQFCYKAQCYETAKKLSNRLSISPERYTVSFQSRLGKDLWTKPYTIDTIRTLAKNGVKKLLVFSPAFVADCLETIYEIKIEGAERFLHLGGDVLDLVESTNCHPEWVKACEKIIKQQAL